MREGIVLDRSEQYKAMLNEDNEMLSEENEILRNKLTAINNFMDKAFVEVTSELKNITKISCDYTIGKRSILNKLKKLL